MRSIRTRITAIILIAIVLAAGLTTALAVFDVVEIGQTSSRQSLELLCQNGEKNLDYYFDSVGHSVEMVSSYAESDLENSEYADLEDHVKRVSTFFGKVARQTNGVLTFYYRIDPEYSDKVTGFWFVDSNGNGYVEHEVTDITQYDINDTTQLVWYTVPRASRAPVWLPPYTTDNLDVRVISYNVPIIVHDEFVGVVGIEIDYTTMANQVDSIRLYDHGYAFLSGEDGTLIYHPLMDVPSLSQEEIPQTPEELKEYEKFIRYTYEGVEKEAYRLPLKNGMIMNVCVPVSEINGNWRKTVTRTVFISIGLIIIFALLAWQATERIIRPLSALAKAAKEVDEGNYDVELKYNGKDEVGVLTATFRTLISLLKAYISDLNDINSKLQEDNLTLEAATIRDSLTGVKNRFALRRDYERYCEKELHLMMLDIDEFKSVNDTYGHSVGDYLLKKTGDALLDNFGADYTYRYGGDEFLVAYPDISEEEFQSIIEATKAQLQEIYLDEKKMPVHFSAGYVYGRTALKDDPRLMLRAADALLYKAKHSGKDSFIGEEYDRESAEKIEKKEEESFRQE